MDTIVQKMLGEFISLYTAETPSWDSIESLVSALNWTELVSQPASTYFSARGVSDNLINEIIDAATRVNYGQNVDELHALEGACSLAASGASQIEGGNWRIFDRFLSESGAKVFTNSTVSPIQLSAALYPNYFADKKHQMERKQ
jgi:prenylcysteine oxidase/farnesylcysteine lyase